MKDYRKIARPLTQLLQKDAFQWHTEAEDAFQVLKKAMTTTQVLALRDFSKEFIVETDASGGRNWSCLDAGGPTIGLFQQGFGSEDIGAFYIRKGDVNYTPCGCPVAAISFGTTLPYSYRS